MTHQQAWLAKDNSFWFEILKNFCKVDFFLRIAGVAVDASDVRGWRPIHHAALHGQTKVVELLIRRGANVNCRKA